MLAEQHLESLRFCRGLTMVAVGATRAPTASSLKGAERTIVYYKGRIWFEACQYDADVLICHVSATRRGDMPHVSATRRGDVQHVSATRRGDVSSFSDGPALTKYVPALDIGYSYCVYCVR